jgi:dsDNA-binding SOS-regulon protein
VGTPYERLKPEDVKDMTFEEMNATFMRIHERAKAFVERTGRAGPPKPPLPPALPGKPTTVSPPQTKQELSPPKPTDLEKKLQVPLADNKELSPPKPTDVEKKLQVPLADNKELSPPKPTDVEKKLQVPLADNKESSTEMSETKEEKAEESVLEATTRYDNNFDEDGLLDFLSQHRERFSRLLATNDPPKVSVVETIKEEEAESEEPIEAPISQPAVSSIPTVSAASPEEEEMLDFLSQHRARFSRLLATTDEAPQAPLASPPPPRTTPASSLAYSSRTPSEIGAEVTAARELATVTTQLVSDDPTASLSFSELKAKYAMSEKPSHSSSSSSYAVAESSFKVTHPEVPSVERPPTSLLSSEEARNPAFGTGLLSDSFIGEELASSVLAIHTPMDDDEEDQDLLDDIGVPAFGPPPPAFGAPPQRLRPWSPGRSYGGSHMNVLLHSQEHEHVIEGDEEVGEDEFVD